VAIQGGSHRPLDGHASLAMTGKEPNIHSQGIG
jgi:hypothetical protein